MSKLKSYKLAREAIDKHMAIQKVEELAALIDWIKERGYLNYIALEIGVQDGGTLWAWSQLFDLAIGVDQVTPSMLPRLHPDTQNMIVRTGNSHDPETQNQVAKLLNYRKVDFLFIDGDHSYKGVKQDYLDYSPLVREGGVIAFHDVADHGSPQQSEVHVFWRNLKKDPFFDGMEVHVHERRDTMRGPIPAASCGIGMMIKQ